MLSFEIFVDFFFGDAGQPVDSFCSENRIWPFMPRFEAIFVFTASNIKKPERNRLGKKDDQFPFTINSALNKIEECLDDS